MNLIDEVFDLISRAAGDFFLQAPQLFTALVISIINLDKSAGDQSAADEQHGDQKIITHQALAAPRPGFPEGEEISEFFFPIGHKECCYLIIFLVRLATLWRMARIFVMLLPIENAPEIGSRKGTSGENR